MVGLNRRNKMSSLTVSNEVLEALEKLAETDGVQVDRLAEDILETYIEQRLVEADISDEELETVNEAIAESQNPSAKWYTTEELEKELAKRKEIRRSPLKSSDII
jgi:hypothetical protein